MAENMLVVMRAVEKRKKALFRDRNSNKKSA
jgi:hypothetical protein